MLEIRNLTVGFWIMSKSNLEKVAVRAVRWPLMEIDCTGLDKIIKNSNNLCKIIRNDLEKNWDEKLHIWKDKNRFLSKWTSFELELKFYLFLNK